MMISDAALEQFGQVITGDQLLFGTKLERIGRGQLPREFCRHGFRSLPARRENQDRPQIFREGLGNEPRPVSPNLARHVIAQISRVYFLKRHWTKIMPDQDRFAAEPMQPFHDILRIGDAAAEQEQLGLGRRERDGQFVVQASVQIADHLVFIHDQERRTIALDEPMFLGLQRRDEHGRAQVLRQVAGGDADVPTTGAPFREFIIG